MPENISIISHYVAYFICMKRRQWQWLPSQYWPAMLQINNSHKISRSPFYVAYFNGMKRRRWQWLPSQYCPAMLQITEREETPVAVAPVTILPGNVANNNETPLTAGFLLCSVLPAVRVGSSPHKYLLLGYFEIAIALQATF